MKSETSQLLFMLQLNLVKDVRCHEKGFYRYIRSKRKTREIRTLMTIETGALVIESMEKVEVPNAFFAFRNSCWEPGGKSGA